MLNRRFANVALLITAAIWAGFAVWLGANPAALLSAFGVEARPPAILTEVRAFYGGVELGIALVMLLLWRRGELVAGLLVGGVPLLGSAAGRCFGLAVDGYSAMHAGFAVFELLGAAFCLAGCAAAKNNS
ncbi:MAG: DUF4345 family protein [Planctomycetota bacterium]